MTRRDLPQGRLVRRFRARLRNPLAQALIAQLEAQAIDTEANFPIGDADSLIQQAPSLLVTSAGVEAKHNASSLSNQPS